MTNSKLSTSDLVVIRAALRAQLSASWSHGPKNKWTPEFAGPCRYVEVTAPKDPGACFIKTPDGYAIEFTVLGRQIVDLGHAGYAEELAQILRAHGVYAQCATPNSDLATVHVVAL